LTIQSSSSSSIAQIRPNEFFDEIRKAKPKELFIAADGPRENNLTDERLCHEARNIVSQVDWDCNVHTLFREKTLDASLQ